MDRQSVFSKTDKGREELRTRALRLPVTARMLLVLADGVKSVSVLAGQCQRGLDVEAVLQALIDLGLIELAASPQAPLPASDIDVLSRRAAPAPGRYVFGIR